MNLSPCVKTRTYQNIDQCSACLVKKGQMRAMVQKANEAFIFRDASDCTPPNLICVENIGKGTYRSERCFLPSNFTTPELTQNLSHRASSN